MEELYEWEVMWPEDNNDGPIGSANSHGSTRKTAPGARSPPSSCAAPLDIPSARPSPGRACGSGDGEEEIEWAPPHVVASRRSAEGKVAFSLCSGLGRTLKGRDLLHVRNSVLRMTGFLEG
ncbi:protein S40-1-like [Musa acuminata AAA Group]|uniref:(wild Malaysian banana) hypothetical protein n=1 Tax=Musa acuminata subsp. malaccensis TaxID=214687 RepID=A0A804KGC0_MUSAM|nr:PREDICTED: uncharacterized protein LOC103997039 [Musa acuminata subsp. malaccensis]CAG1834290.1 unnamed protein product [Musa acuminata subsp. malaccensis]